MLTGDVASAEGGASRTRIATSRMASSASSCATDETARPIGSVATAAIAASERTQAWPQPIERRRSTSPTR